MQAPATVKTVRFNHVRADEMYLTGDFNHWSIPGLRMRQVESGCWEMQIPAECAAGRFALAALVKGRVVEIVSGFAAQTADPEPDQPSPARAGALLDGILCISA